MGYLNEKGIKLAVIGSRSFTDKERVFNVLDKNIEKIKMIVSGGCNGPDDFSHEWAKERGIPILVFYPKWYNNGVFDRGAGFKRNAEIVKASNMVLAFYDGVSKGTANSLEIAKKLGKPTKIILKNEVPRLS